MNAEIKFEIIAIFLFAILIFINRIFNDFPTRTNNIYKQLIILSIQAPILNIITLYLCLHTETTFLLVLNNILATMCILATNTIYLAYYQLVLSITHDQVHFSRKEVLTCVIPYAFVSLSIILSPFTHFVMYFDENGVYSHNVGFMVLYFIATFYVILSMIHLCKNRKKISHEQFWVIIFYSVLVIAAAIYQLFNPDTYVISLAEAIALFLFCYTLKNPSSHVDHNYGLYNRASFKEYWFYKREIHSDSAAVLLQLTNVDQILYKFGVDNGYYAIRKCIEQLQQLSRRKPRWFLIDTNTILFFTNSKDEAITMISRIKDKISDFFLVPVVNNSSDLQFVTLKLDTFLLNDLTQVSFPQKPGSTIVEADVVIDFFKHTIKKYYTSEAIKTDPTLIGTRDFNEFGQFRKIQTQVNQAIIDESFEVHMQPIYDIKKKCFTSAEALIRLRDKEGNYIPPTQFIPFAEENGTILQIGNIMLKRALEYIREGRLAEHGIEKININLSMIQCMQDNIAEQIIKLIEAYRIPKKLIRFEITETIMTNNPDKLYEVMTKLLEQGIEFALDDYGMGYSNTNRLLSFPFSEIKFDKSFIDAAEKDEKNSLSLKHLMSMVKDANMTVLIEGVETKEMADLIEKYNGDLIQGFYYALPVPVDEFIEIVDKLKK